MFSFTAKKSDEINKILKDKNAVINLLNCYGSPLNILIPQEMDKNILEFTNVFKKNNLVGKIFYAHKCNKSNALVKQALNNNICIDVASLEELKDAISSGYTGDKIEATGPKNDEFIILGLRHNIIFNVDSIEELEKIAKFKKEINNKNKIKILLRLNNFKSKETKIINKNSRFGTNKEDLSKLLEIIDNNNTLQLLGLSFHLDTVNKNEKVIAIENCIEIFEQLFEEGYNPSVLNIGGGYKVNYLEDKNEWNNSITMLKEDILSGKNELRWNNASFGLREEKGTLKGTLNIYNYFDEIVKGDYLEDILSTKLHKYQNRSIAEILSENMIDIYIEPGRSLLDLAGINLARVNFVKNTNGNTLVGLDMKRSDLLIGDQEMLVDPILISKDLDSESQEKCGVYFVGNLCMENDLIYKHKVYLNKCPKAGDVIVFINTAGYFMDFEQSNTIKQKVASKIVAYFEKEEIKYFNDDNYEPLLIKGE